LIRSVLLTAVLFGHITVARADDSPLRIRNLSQRAFVHTASAIDGFDYLRNTVLGQFFPYLTRTEPQGCPT
jgi:hypothetical protein